MNDPVREALVWLVERHDHDWCRAALAALDRERARAQRLERAIRTVIADGESQHPGGWGPDVTMLRVLQDALRAEVDDDE